MTLWLVGGRDPTGGAGVTRDALVAAERAPTLSVVAVVSAETEQGDGRPARAHAIDSDVLASALRGIDGAAAVKVGLVPAAVSKIVAAALQEARCPRVVDPVLWASDGGDMGTTTLGALELTRVADLVTPNRREACALFGRAPESPEAALAAVAARRATAWLFKDADRRDERWVCDWLVVDDRVTELRRPRRTGPDPRGTGCALATAIACELACGHPLVDACRVAIAWLDDARQSTHVGPDGRHHLLPRPPRS